MGMFSRLSAFRQENGMAYTVRRLGQKAGELLLGTWQRKWRKEYPGEEELRRQHENQPASGLISVTVPVYNTDPAMLNALLESLRTQTLLNWEAVLYDGGSTNPETVSALDAAARNEPRFRVVHAEENLGISGNTNRAIALARGQYIVLCDHDDWLRPDALWRVADVIAREAPDWVYSDEDRLTGRGKRHLEPHRKPDFCPETLLNDNYICHLTALRKSLLEQAGCLRSSFDGSQDHDLFLRCAAISRRVSHIPEMLYSWRRVRSSASRQNLERCLDASCRAAEAAEKDAGRNAVVLPIGTVPRLWLDFPRGASVEAVIFGSDERYCRECFSELEAAAPWPRLTATLAVTDLGSLYETLNEAAEKSTADYLLFLDAASQIRTRHFFRELLMYASRDGVAGVSPVLTDRKGRITHAGFILGGPETARCVGEGLPRNAGGYCGRLKKVRNVSAVSICCQMVRRDRFLPFDTRFRSGLGSIEQGFRQRARGLRFVCTPQADMLCEDSALLLTGKKRYGPDQDLIRQACGLPLQDPCSGEGLE